jgi:casein kinase II subunit beta
MSESEQESGSTNNWINWFCSLEDHEFYCRVDDDYIRDAFNLYGLKSFFNNYNEALEMVLS